jgi:hypothetical protein
MAHPHLFYDFLFVHCDESSNVIFLVGKDGWSAILRATSSLGVIGVVGSLQGADNGIERPLHGTLS